MLFPLTCRNKLEFMELWVLISVWAKALGQWQIQTPRIADPPLRGLEHFLSHTLLFSTQKLLRQRESISKGLTHWVSPETPLKTSHRFLGGVMLVPSAHRCISFTTCNYYHVGQQRLFQWNQNAQGISPEWSQEKQSPKSLQEVNHILFLPQKSYHMNMILHLPLKKSISCPRGFYIWISHRVSG